MTWPQLAVEQAAIEKCEITSEELTKELSKLENEIREQEDNIRSETEQQSLIEMDILKSERGLTLILAEVSEIQRQIEEYHNEEEKLKAENEKTVADAQRDYETASQQLDQEMSKYGMVFHYSSFQCKSCANREAPGRISILIVTHILSHTHTD